MVPVPETRRCLAIGFSTVQYRQSNPKKYNQSDRVGVPLDASQLCDRSRPVPIELEVPAGVIDEGALDDALVAMTINARLTGE